MGRKRQPIRHPLRGAGADKPRASRVKVTHVTPTASLGDVVLNFGKHRGERLADVPRSYLEWCVENLEHSPMRQRIREYLRTHSA